MDDVERLAIIKSLATVVREYVATIKVEKGDKGDPGENGAAGADGKDAEPVDLDALATRAAALVVLPIAKDGVDGRDGEKGDPGEKGDKGEKGDPGENGESVTAEDFRHLFEAEHAKWTLEFERRASDQVQKFLEKIPMPTNGKDGFGFDDMTVIHDGERTITLRFARGAEIKEFPIEIPALIERGVFKRGDRYARGDGVSYGGSFWIAQGATDEVPGDGATAWRLAVKKGRDGKDGRDGDAPRIVKFGAK